MSELGPHRPSTAAFSADPFGDAATLVTLSGELDRSNSSSFDRWIHAAVKDQNAPLVLDLSGVTWLDSAAMAVIVSLAREYGINKTPLGVIAPPDPIWEMFRMVGLQDLFTLFSSRNQAAKHPDFGQAEP